MELPDTPAVLQPGPAISQEPLTGDAATKGGIIGNSYSGNTITDNHFLATAAGNGIGSPASDSGAAPTSDADLKKQATFNSVNWDFSTVWYVNQNNAYPVLRAPAPYASDITLNLILPAQ